MMLKALEVLHDVVRLPVVGKASNHSQLLSRQVLHGSPPSAHFKLLVPSGLTLCLSLLPLLLSDKVALRKESGRCISALAPHVSDQLFSDIFSRFCEALAVHRVDIRTTAAIGLQLLVRDASDRVPCAKLIPLLIEKLEEAIARSELALSFRVVRVITTHVNQCQL
jgi:hypothetical protein